MFLRVGDTLIDLLIGSIRVMDRINQSLRVRILDGLTHLKAFENYVKQLGISGYSFWIGKQSKQLKWRTLTGPEMFILLTNIDIPSVFPTLPYKSEVQKLWKDFITIQQLFSSKPDELTPETISRFEALSKSFVSDFTDICPSKHITPYMHCMMYHVGEFMQLHGSILMFTQQGLEKYNDIMTKDYFRSTSHRNERCLMQILQKQNRLEHLDSLGAKWQKRHEIHAPTVRKRATISGLARLHVPSAESHLKATWSALVDQKYQSVV